MDLRSPRADPCRGGGQGGAAEGGIRARLTDVVFQGTTMLLAFEAQGIGSIRAERPPAEVVDLRPGDEVVLTLRGGHLVPCQVKVDQGGVEAKAA
jgi:hypothetical protein